jgi:hypothetical protein
MSKDKYIDKVLSHIKSKKQKNEIELELFDHIDEHEKFFIDIGYDKEKAVQNADGKMGDADIVGEQLDSIKKHFKINYYILFVIQIVFLITYIIYERDNFYVSPLNLSVYYFDYVAYTIIILISLLCCYIGLKKKNFICLISGSISSIVTINLKPYFIQTCILYLFNKKTLYTFFYQLDYSGYNEIDLANHSVFNIIISLILTLIILAISITGIITLIKTKLFKNSKRDNKLKNIAAITTLIIILISAILLGYNHIQTFINRDNMIAQTEGEIEELNNIVTDNANEFKTIDPDELQKVLDKHFEYGDNSQYRFYVNNKLYINESENQIAFVNVDITNDTLTIEIRYNLIDPLKPNSSRLSLDIDRNIYTYTASTDEYEIYSDFNGNSVSLSDDKENQLESTLTEYFKDNDYLAKQKEIHELMDSYIETKYYFFTKIYDVCYNKTYDTYKIDMSYCAYYPTIQSNQIVNKESTRGIISVKLKFVNDTVKIIQMTEYPNSSEALIDFSDNAIINCKQSEEDEYFKNQMSNVDEQLSLIISY